MKTQLKKVTVGQIYFADAKSTVTEVRPADNKAFSLQEIQQAVGGFFQLMIAKHKGATVHVNEEGAVCGHPLNLSTWEFADRRTYIELNGYAKSWLVQGAALVTYRVPPYTKPLPTIAEILATRGGAR